MAGIFATEEEAQKAVDALIQEHFDPPHDLSVIVSHRREHEDVPVPESFDIWRWATIGAVAGAVLGTGAVALTGMAVGPITLVAAGPVAAALEAACAGGGTGFMIGVLHGLMESRDEADFHPGRRAARPPRRALLFNLLSGLTFLVGGLIAYFASLTASVAFLVPFAAGNVLYIGASDLIPEVNRHTDARRNVEHFLAFSAGMALLLWLEGLGR